MDKMKILGLTATVLGFGLTMVNDWVSDKKTEKEISEKVIAAVKDLKESK
nr:MAG TPA: hypothetical protein [Caudoviricetes sp.]